MENSGEKNCNFMHRNKKSFITFCTLISFLGAVGIIAFFLSKIYNTSPQSIKNFSAFLAPPKPTKKPNKREKAKVIKKASMNFTVLSIKHQHYSNRNATIS
jgi:hypothetical protein